jgi:hypothetical protein
MIGAQTVSERLPKATIYRLVAVVAVGSAVAALATEVLLDPPVADIT